MVDVVQHDAAAACLADCLRRWFARLDQPEARGEFARAEAGLMEALALAGAPVERVEFEAGGDDIGDVSQHGGGALLACAFDNKRRPARSPLRIARRALAAGTLLPTVATDRLETDRLQDVDGFDYPADGGFPVDASRLPRTAEGIGTSYETRSTFISGLVKQALSPATCSLAP
jgi:hypothetical protein